MTECLMCGHGAFGNTVERSEYRYATCGRCGTASLQAGWEHADYESRYFTAGSTQGYFDYEADRDLHLETAGRRLDAAIGVFRNATSVIDVGAALGFGLQAAANRGMNPVGVEISDFARGHLQDRGFEVYATLGEVDGVFDAVIFGQVLEHMPQPAEALATAYGVLPPGGALFIETWDYSSTTARRFGKRWQQIAPPSVVHLFTAEGLRQLADRTGFIDVHIRPWSKRVSVGGYLGVIAAKLPTPIGRALMWVARVTRLSRIAITYKFDDLIAVTARKPG